MASKGPMVVGTDGSDHIHRQIIATHYSQSVVNKSRLRFAIIMHYLLLGLMLAKLADDILDRFDIFILELQELYIPKPLIWEWIWSFAALSNLIATKSMRKNSFTMIKVYLFIIVFTAILPLVYALGYFFSDFWTFLETRDLSKLTHVWNKYPLAILWYIFIVVALQIHLAEVCFGYNLLKTWSSKRVKSQ